MIRILPRIANSIPALRHWIGVLIRLPNRDRVAMQLDHVPPHDKREHEHEHEKTR
jgi:hypothetical protein